MDKNEAKKYVTIILDENREKFENKVFDRDVKAIKSSAGFVTLTRIAEEVKEYRKDIDRLIKEKEALMKAARKIRDKLNKGKYATVGYSEYSSKKPVSFGKSYNLSEEFRKRRDKLALEVTLSNLKDIRKIVKQAVNALFKGI